MTTDAASPAGGLRGPMTLGVERLTLRGAAVMTALSLVLAGILLDGQRTVLPIWWTVATAAAQCALLPLLVVAVRRGGPARVVLVAVFPALLLVLLVLSFVRPGSTGVLPGAVAAWFYEGALMSAALGAFVLTTGATLGLGILTGVLYTCTRLRLGDGSGWVSPYTDGAFVLVVAAGSLGVLRALRSAAADRDAADRALNAATADRERQISRAAERSRLDAFVHDDLLHLLLATARPGTVPDADITRLALVARNRLTAGLDAAPAADTAELLARIRRLARDWGVPLSGGGPVTAAPLPPRAATALERATREALRNSLRHADPGHRDDADRPVHRHVTVRCGTTVSVLVSDDGVGFDPGTGLDDGTGLDGAGKGWGLRHSLFEPMEGCGGTAHVESRPGGGTRVELTWPARGHHGGAL